MTYKIYHYIFYLYKNKIIYKKFYKKKNKINLFVKLFIIIKYGIEKINKYINFK